MKITKCDKCGKEIEYSNKVHIYNYSVRINGDKQRVVLPKREDRDVCNDCRRKIIKWFGGKEK